MAKAKSVKVRTLLTLHALFKYTDEEHRLNTAKVNEFLRPYGLDCTCWTLQSFIQAMRDLGIDVRFKGTQDNRGFWLEERPLPEHKLKWLIYAIDTNPYLSKSQTAEILQSLKPFVTVYQEDLLQGIIEADHTTEVDDSLYWTYSVIREAIYAKRKVLYSAERLKYDKGTRSVVPYQKKATPFTPKYIYRAKDQLYMVGYNNTSHRIDAVNLKDITSIRLAVTRSSQRTDMVNELLAGIKPKELLPGENKKTIYDGPAVFLCRGQYAGELYHRFGPPDGPVIKDSQCRISYTVRKAVITPETLLWLSLVPDHGIRIKGPKPLTEAVKDYYKRTSETLLTPVIAVNKKKECS